jgi:hypothetical protein
MLSCSSFSSDNYFILRSKASSLTRKRVCSSQCNHSLVRSVTPNHTLLPHLRWSWSSSCGQQSVDQYVWVLGLPLGSLTRFYLARLLSFENYVVLLSMRPFWRENGSVIYCTIASGPCLSNHTWTEVPQNSGHILLSHLRLPQPGGPGSCIYVLQEQGSPVIPPGTGFPFCRLLRLAGTTVEVF